MVLRYWGERGVDAESFAHLVDRTAAGIRTTTLVGALQERGWNVVAVAGTEDLIATEIDRGRPVLALVEDRPGTFHYIVIVASTPRGVVFHDPARAPYRVMDREQFRRRWSSADRWMAVVVPARAEVPQAPVATLDLGGEGASCTTLVAQGVRQAQSNQLEAAERSLTSAVACGGPAPLRELAGLRLLQRRWPEVSELATAALAEDPRDSHAWDLLAASRFVQNDPTGALAAWNNIDRPRVDLVAFTGLTRTRQRVAERLLAVPRQALLTPQLQVMTSRRLDDLPSAISTRLEFVPSASGLAELRAHVVERPLLPSDAWSYLALALRAGARNEIDLTAGSLTGGGERIRAGWRFWPGRPRVHVEMTAPAPWGGLWGVDGFGERQPFSDDGVPTARRAGVGVSVSRWVGPWARVSARAGVDAWDGAGSYGVALGSVQLRPSREWLSAEIHGSGWSGSDGFGLLTSTVHMRSTGERRGRVFRGQAGVAAATSSAPPDLWFAGDTGRSRPIRLRAHPLIESGQIRVDRIGRRIVHGSVEVQQWWSTATPVTVGAAAFADTAGVGHQMAPGVRRDVDVGVGLRITAPGLAGTFRVDVAKGLRDGATALSFVYEP